MAVYLAYGLLVVHVTLGALQSETNPSLAATLGVGVSVVVGLHLAAAYRERRLDILKRAAGVEGFVEVSSADSIPDRRAKVISLMGERIAVFRYDGKVSALSNVCAHQNGPLGEGRIIDGCVTCPWHGYQYLPASGASPPPFHEKVATFRVKVINGKVHVHPRPYPPGTPLEPATIAARTEMPEPNDFYIGYEPKMARSFARHVTRTVIGLNAMAVVVALLLVFGQQPFEPSAFEFHQYRDFEGIIEDSPVPTLLVDRPGGSGSSSTVSRYLLVATGKNGAGPQLLGLHGRRVHLQGSLIYREGLTMIELAPSSQPVALPSNGTAQTETLDLGVHTLKGEVVDSKCYFGVMNPGHGKVHRDCAVRCISGGIPPALLVRNQTGEASLLLLQGSDGRQLNSEVLDHVGEPLEIRGQVLRSGDTLIFTVEPAALRQPAVAR